jgi:hypothetical protein
LADDRFFEGVVLLKGRGVLGRRFVVAFGLFAGS